MRVEIKKGYAKGSLRVPPSKSCAHRLLLGAALADGVSTLRGVDFNEDILATIDCINSIGIKTIIENNAVIVEGCRARFLEKKEELPRFFCRESGSTLRFMIPLAMLGGGGVFGGTPRLISRGVGIYEELFSGNAEIRKGEGEISLCGSLTPGKYCLAGNVSSQFITGLLYALPTLSGESEIEGVLPCFAFHFNDCGHCFIFIWSHSKIKHMHIT